MGSLGAVMGRHARASGLLLALVASLLTGCATVTGTPTWPGARLDKVLLTEDDFPPGVQFDRITETAGEPDGAGGPPAMLSTPRGCSDGLTQVIASTAERGPGSAAKYVVAYDGARIVMTVLTSKLPMDRLAAVADRCAHFQAFFDPSGPGIPITTTKVDGPRPDALAYQQTMRLGGEDTSVYFSFENVGPMAVFGIALPVPNSSIAAKGTLPQTFLEIAARQAERAQSG